MVAPGTGGSKFQGKCYNFRKTGHQSHEFPDNNKKGINHRISYNKINKTNYSNNQTIRKCGPRLYGNCHESGKYGHQKTNCWKYELNVSKRPNKYSSVDTVIAAEEKSEYKSVDSMLMNVKMETISGREMIFSDNQNPLNDPNIMI